ncbi:MAG: N-acetylmuramoyl-L-alanine amidase, partial [Acidobacteriota bacterium]
RANHAGKGAQQVLDEVNRGVAPTGTAKARGLPENRIGNGHFYGFENLNVGDGADPWPEAQLTTMARGAAALCQRHGWSSSRVISHAEWEKQKSDPSGIDMNLFRARVASHF